MINQAKKLWNSLSEEDLQHLQTLGLVGGVGAGGLALGPESLDPVTSAMLTGALAGGAGKLYSKTDHFAKKALDEYAASDQAKSLRTKRGVVEKSMGSAQESLKDTDEELRALMGIKAALAKDVSVDNLVKRAANVGTHSAEQVDAANQVFEQLLDYAIKNNVSKTGPLPLNQIHTAKNLLHTSTWAPETVSKVMDDLDLFIKTQPDVLRDRKAKLENRLGRMDNALNRNRTKDLLAADQYKRAAQEQLGNTALAVGAGVGGLGGFVDPLGS